MRNFHGKSNTRLFRIWAHIKDRCFNVNNDAYKNYGARGIIMCTEWKNNFMSFYIWANNNGYKDNLTIDRINNDGNYEPTNCRWITSEEQHKNTRKNKILQYNGESLCARDWSKRLNINYSTLLSRLKRGWNTEKALSIKEI